MPKKTLYFPDHIIPMVDAREDQGESFSGRVNFLIAVAYEVARESAPPLKLGEWLALLDANNSMMIDYSGGPEPVLKSMLIGIWDEAGAYDLRFKIDSEGLVRRLRNMPVAQQFAIFEVVRGYWASGEAVSKAGSDREALKVLGANISD